MSKWRRENPERYRDYQAQYRTRDDYKQKMRDGHLRRTFGISVDDYERMLEEQGGGCAICGAPEPEGRSLHVDHHHASGEVRGLVCFTCDAAIGQLKDDQALVLRAADYLAGSLETPVALEELNALARARVRALAG